MKVYIVYMGSLPSRADYTPMSDHMSILQEVTGERCDFSLIYDSISMMRYNQFNVMNILTRDNIHSSSNEGRLVRSYKRSFNGFAARLTASELERVAGECFSIDTDR